MSFFFPFKNVKDGKRQKGNNRIKKQPPLTPVDDARRRVLAVAQDGLDVFCADVLVVEVVGVLL